MTSSGIYIPTAPFTDLLDRSSFVELYIMPISYPRKRALPVWACVISVFSADKVSFSSVWSCPCSLRLNTRGLPGDRHRSKKASTIGPTWRHSGPLHRDDAL